MRLQFMRLPGSEQNSLLQFMRLPGAEQNTIK